MNLRTGYPDRAEGGRRLARAVAPEFAHRPDVVVLGLPRGGVTVAAEVAAALRAPLDVFVVRKLGHPRRPELALGAVASGGTVAWTDPAACRGVPARDLRDVLSRETAEVARRERAYRGGLGPPEVAGRTVLLVDDGLATGSTMLAAATALRNLGAKEVVAAAPVGSDDACDALLAAGFRVVCPWVPRPFSAVGQAYDDSCTVEDEDVRSLLAAARDTLGRSRAAS